MSRPSLQAVIHACLGEPAEAGLNPRQRQVCHHLLDCRTAALGGFCLECDQCQDRAFVYHACRDRHCPRCQRRASQDWCERQRAAVLPVTYHHLVFTLPDTLNGWVEVHPQEVYGLLFETVWATLSAFGADPKRLDGQLGMTAMLHTWGQTLVRHVHRHCLMPGGAFAADGTWHPAKSTSLFPVRALSRHFRGGFVGRLRRAREDGKLSRIQMSLHRKQAAAWRAELAQADKAVGQLHVEQDGLGRSQAELPADLVEQTTRLFALPGRHLTLLEFQAESGGHALCCSAHHVRARRRNACIPERDRVRRESVGPIRP